jgi:hypothetical protein
MTFDVLKVTGIMIKGARKNYFRFMTIYLSVAILTSNVIPSSFSAQGDLNYRRLTLAIISRKTSQIISI